MDLFDLKGRVAVVSGASSGLGKRFAEVLANHGADVAILARRLDKLKENAALIEAAGGRCLPLQCDVTNEANVAGAVKQIIAHFGKIDILVNNAGIALGTKAEETTGADFCKVMDVNTNAIFYLCREAGKNMIANKYGRIINISSMYGLVGNKFMPALSYHASKGAIVNFTRGLAAEWAKYNITVNSIGPGFFHSEMTDKLMQEEAFLKFVQSSCCLERCGNPDELDTALMFLAANGSGYITGQTVYVDGGWTAV